MLAVVAWSCQLTETMTLNEDGSGRLSISMDMKEMMAFSGIMEDSATAMQKLDTIISMKDFLEEKKDSIAQLPADEQARLKKLENFKFRSVVNSETQEMFMDVFTDFTSVEQANDLMGAFEESGNFMQGLGDDTTIERDEKSGGIMGVAFAYANGKFKRDAFILDKAKHQMQVDSMKQAEAFMEQMTYKIKYTFPRKIKSASATDARLTMDGKTIEIERKFIDYLKNPDVLDLEVELEN